MTKHQNRASQQLELRLLSVLTSNPEATQREDAAAKARLGVQPLAAIEGASEHDKSVYRSIANNYFDSLRK